jgi:two-component system cell cycle sensor histidine kinase/response regulator CckA
MIAMPKARILVVEDESIVAMDIGNMLEKMGYEVIDTVPSGEKAIQKASENQTDLVLMDIMLKGDMDGIQTAEKIRELFHIPVIYLTANAEDNTLQRAKITEPYGYIIKPFQERELNTTIEIAIYKHKSEKQLEESEKWLRRSELQYRTTINSLNDYMHVIDTDMRIVLFNDAIKKWNTKLGLETDVVGCNLFDVFPFLSDVAQSEYSYVFTTGEILITEETNIFGDMNIITETQKIPIFEDNKVVRIITAIRDITERKKIEEEAIKAQRLESLALLAGGIAHDFNNILTIIMGGISLAMMYTDQIKVQEKLADAEKAFSKAKNLTQQLLTFSKGGIPVKKTTFIDELLRDSTIFSLSGSNIKYNFNIPDDLWAVYIDEGQIGQVIGNLVINANQAMPKGGIINIYAQNITLAKGHGLPLEDGQYVKVSIEDQGGGIPEELLPRIFEPYFTTKKDGNGLGLAISHRIIKNHGGYITVESRIEIGTIFHIYLPVSTEPILKANKKEDKEEKIIEGKGKILVIDDEEIIQELVFNILTNFGYKVEMVSDNAQAINLYEETKVSNEPFDLIIMDLMMPGEISGLEAIQHLRDFDPEVKAIISSGFSNDPIMINFNEYGFKGAVPKPYGIKELVEAVNKVITDRCTLNV